MHTWIGVLTFALAAGAGALELPESVRALPRQGSQCKQQDASGNDAPPPLAPEPVPDFACAAGALAVQQRGAAAMLIDLRRADQFAAYHIPGAVQLSASELRSRPFLKGKPLVLVGSGRQDVELYALCGELKRAGFARVEVLQGGLLNWVRQGFAVAGNPPAAVELARLQPDELYQASRFSENAILALPDSAGLREQLLQAVPLAKATPDAVQALLKARRKALPGVPLAAVTLVGDAALDGAAWQALQRALPQVPVLHYSGAAEYQRFARQQQAQWQARERGPKQPRCGG
ncbi:rhodanese-like domain-containing protein [Chitiniphilus purpureus]|uniref:Rhodanese-like domain-containing protein n=1 Tax=Chitiniphilus purpureus TaxID=2981137 RepID=A0ABY6DLI7_9NEIS|nr:rhodanese-like domain-containing protein [Chitiniphilus sp. CD1]UXY15211.1 rhodanese-like domain-containing protein [Chitiniphilus sp. CD1]